MIKIIALGKVKDAHIAALTSNYVGRMKHIEVIELRDERIQDDEEKVKSLEAQRILKVLEKNRGLIIACDEHGEGMGSLDFAALCKNEDVTFIIGGALGLHQTVLDRADKIIALSQMTFPHQLARLFLIEQLYRATTINQGKSYHK